MYRLRLSPRAATDLRRLLAKSHASWGAEGAARYAATLATAMEMILAAPLAPNTRDRAALAPGLRCLHPRRARHLHGVHAPVHVIYYRLAADIVEVVRILHEHMDPRRHLSATARTRRATKRTQ